MNAKFGILVSFVLAFVIGVAPVATVSAVPAQQDTYDCSGYGEGVTGVDKEGNSYVCKKVDGKLRWILQKGDDYDCSGYNQGVEAEAGGRRYRCEFKSNQLRWVEIEKTDPMGCSVYARKYGTGVTGVAEGGVLYRCDGSKWQEWLPPNASIVWSWEKTDEQEGRMWRLDILYVGFCLDTTKVFGVKGGQIATENYLTQWANGVKEKAGNCPYHSDPNTDPYSYIFGMHVWLPEWELKGLEAVEIWWGNPTANHKTTRIPLPR